MKKKFLLALFVTIFGIMTFANINVSAATYGDLTYEISNGEVTITDCDTSAIGEMVIPETINGYPVTAIGVVAFSYCTGLTSVTIPDNVTRIGSSAFSDCSRLTSITIPDSVTSVGLRAFDNCKGLTSVNITDIAVWCQIDFGDEWSNPLCYAKKIHLNGELITDLIIPDSVTTIGSFAFYNCDSLTSVTIPSSVTTIGSSAFSGCGGLTNVTIPDGVTSIGRGAFSGCGGLTNVTIPSSVTSTGDYTFMDCTGLTNVTILTGVTSIGYNTFSYCTSLTSVTIPDSITSIGNKAFYNCTSLTSVTIPDSVTSIGYDAFRGCAGLTRVTIPSSVTSIGEQTFYNCTSLTSVTIPDSVTRINYGAFHNCTGLTSVTIPNSVIFIDDEAFSDCNNISNVYYGGTEEEWAKIIIDTCNDPLLNATIHFTESELEKYRLNSITLRDFSGDELTSIPDDVFLATISFTNVSATEDNMIILAQYSAEGEFGGLMYVTTEDVPIGSTIKISIPVDNTNGNIATLKAFCWDSFGSFVPLGNAVTFGE